MEVITTVQQISDSLTEIYANAEIAVDCEGVNLRRNGQLTIVSVATEAKVYIFDVLSLGQPGFDAGLRDLLENKDIVKVMFDCREDSDALWHQHNVLLRGVMDVQLLEILLRRCGQSGRLLDPSSVALTELRSHMESRRTTSHGCQDFLLGFDRCLGKYAPDRDSFAIKARVKAAMVSGAKNLWLQRPLTADMKSYCAVDTRGLFRLYHVLLKRPGFSLGIRQRAADGSIAYANYFKDIPHRNYGKFEENNRLPSSIDLFLEFGSVSGWGGGNRECQGCRHSLPHVLVGKYSKYCLVCARIK